MHNVGQAITQGQLLEVKEEPEDEGNAVPRRAMLCRQLSSNDDYPLPSVLFPSVQCVDQSPPRALMMKRKRTRKATQGVILDTRHGYYREVKCFPLIVDDVTMPHFTHSNLSKPLFEESGPQQMPSIRLNFENWKAVRSCAL